MADEYSLSRIKSEEIQGAPPVTSLAELRERRLSETVILNKYLYHQSQQLEHMLLDAGDLQSLLEVLLVSLPRHFSLQVAELWLHDPEGVLADLIIGGERYGHHLQLISDVYEMQELYSLEPDVAIIDATDSRMFEILQSEHGIDHALLLPLMNSGRLIGSLHLGIQDEDYALGDQEEDLLAHLTEMISCCVRQGIARQQISRLTVLDPLTEISNLRGFERDINREIARARRADHPFSIVIIEIDEYDDLYEHYGDVRGQFVVKKVTQRIASDLRATDLMARLSRSRLAVLIPCAGEGLAQDIGERMRRDIEEFSIDDGRGAVLQVTLSVGLVTWEPQQYPAVDMVQLARQMESVADKALKTAVSGGGNRVVLSRLSTLIV